MNCRLIAALAAALAAAWAGEPAAFFCVKCRKPAETMTLELDKARLRSSDGAQEVGPAKFLDMKKALEQGDAGALHKLGERWAPMFCPECRACYCRTHWFRDEGPPPWGDSHSWNWVEFGTCPQGHRRILREL